MHYRQIITSCALALFMTTTPVLAGGSPAIDVTSGYNQQPAQSARAATNNTDTADALIKALTRRSLTLSQRNPTPASPAAAQAPRPRLSSRLSGAASHRTAAPSAPAANLLEYLGILGRTTPGGRISGRFADWRSPSVYRSVGGRHNGYDVALPAGATIVVGWPGRVSAITHWYGREYGITIDSPDGFHTTYGHLSPGVRIGQMLEPGDVVGTVCNDHVDIKMKDAQGHPIDFARVVPLAGAGDRPQASALVAGILGNETSVFPPLAGPDWTQRAAPVAAALAYVRLRYQEAALLSAGTAAPAPMLAQVQQQIAEARKQLAIEEVPEEVLLAAFLDSENLQSTFSISDATAGTNSNVLAEWLRRQQVVKEARQAGPQLQQLLVDLGK